MAIEHEELRLSVTLNDQASASLGNLQAALNNIGSAAGPAQQGLNQLAASLKGAGGHAQQLHGSLAGMAAQGGFIAGFFAEIGKGAEKMAKDMANAVFNIKQYADAMVQLEQAASRASTSAAQFQRNVSVFRESGVSAADAAKNIEGFANALGDLQREQSNIRTRLLEGLNPTEFAAMTQHLRRLQTSDRETAMQEAKNFGIRIRESFAAEGQAARGAVAQQEYYNLLRMPDLDKLRDPFEKITPQLEHMYALRKDNAERMQTAVEKTSDATERGVRSVQASALYMLPITEAMEAVGIVAHNIAEWLESWEESIGDADKALTNNLRGGGGGFWDWLAQKAGLQGTRTRGHEIDEQRGQNPQGPAKPAAPAGPRTWRPGMRTQLMGDGGVPSANGPGSAVGLGVGGAVDRLPEEYEEIGWRQIEDRRNEVPDLRQGAAPIGAGIGDPVEDNSTELEALVNELRRLNDFLAPSSIMNPAFHNAPMGGAEGESNPVQLPPGVSQPGGGAAAEARDSSPAGFRGGREAAVEAGSKLRSGIAGSVDQALKMVGLNEKKDQDVLKEYMQTGGRNLTSDQNAWCARYVNAINVNAGLPSLESKVGAESGWSSRAFERWGNKVDLSKGDTIQAGDVLVKARGNDPNKGHVGVATGNYRYNPDTGVTEYEMLSGNIGGEKTIPGTNLPAQGGGVGLTYETIGGKGRKGAPGAGQGGVIAVRRGEAAAAVADTGPEEGGGKGKRLDAPGTDIAQKALDDRLPSFSDDLSGMSFSQRAKSVRMHGRYLPESPISTNIEDRRRIDLSGDPGGLEGTGDPGPFNPSEYGTADLPGGGYESWLGRTRTRTGQSSKDLSEQLGIGAIPESPPGAGFQVEGQTQGVANLAQGNGADTFSDRFGEWDGGNGNAIPAGQPGSEFPGPSSSGRAGQVVTDEQLWNAILAVNPYAKPIVTASGLVHSLTRTEGEDPFRGPADVLDRAAASSIDVSTSGLFSVNVNAPEGTKVKAEGSGVLEKSEVNRTVTTSTDDNEEE